MNDLEFVQRCVTGDKLAWHEFVDKYSRLIYKYNYCVLHTKDPRLAQESADDLLQEIFLLLVKDNFKKLKSFQAKNGCSLASWLRQVAVNHTIDYLRRTKPTISLDEPDEDGLILKDIFALNNPHALDRLSDQEKLKNLKSCIDALEKDDKYFLELYINRGLTLEEMRGHLRISRGAVDMRRSRIIERLKECFQAKGFKLDF